MKEEAFAKLAPQLRSLAQKVSRGAGASKEEAEDIAQDAMLRLWQMHDELERFNSLEAVTARIAHNLTLSLHRKPILDNLNGKEITLLQPSPAETLEDKENDEWMQQRIDQLPDTEHTILMMRQVEQRSNKEIAQLLGIAETSVSTLLARARRRLLEDIKRRNKQ
ncbi:RNA polymerase sigma factor [Prevotella sp. HUN102]|uniref:RNA polymerase sigma factor n=1 Tax=Prevotella sp. HUN102 TaxID=1392486 RepID=UPI0004907CEF|nr:sigma-70 family RNA polymerase sigma factor [Prevotella sp. HUN102]